MVMYTAKRKGIIGVLIHTFVLDGCVKAYTSASNVEQVDLGVAGEAK